VEAKGRNEFNCLVITGTVSATFLLGWFPNVANYKNHHTNEQDQQKDQQKESCAAFTGLLTTEKPCEEANTSPKQPVKEYFSQKLSPIFARV
jgi:hypothetical protein